MAFVPCEMSFQANAIVLPSKHCKLIFKVFSFLREFFQVFAYLAAGFPNHFQQQGCFAVQLH